MSCGIGASRPKQLFRLIVTWKGPLLPHGLIDPGGGTGSLPHPPCYLIDNRQGGFGGALTEAREALSRFSIPVVARAKTCDRFPPVSVEPSSISGPPREGEGAEPASAPRRPAFERVENQLSGVAPAPSAPSRF